MATITGTGCKGVSDNWSLYGIIFQHEADFRGKITQTSKRAIFRTVPKDPSDNSLHLKGQVTDDGHLNGTMSYDDHAGTTGQGKLTALMVNNVMVGDFTLNFTEIDPACSGTLQAHFSATRSDTK
jgi:hypothetical protein